MSMQQRVAMGVRPLNAVQNQANIANQNVKATLGLGKRTVSERDGNNSPLKKTTAQLETSANQKNTVEQENLVVPPKKKPSVDLTKTIEDKVRGISIAADALSKQTVEAAQVAAATAVPAKPLPAAGKAQEAIIDPEEVPMTVRAGKKKKTRFMLVSPPTKTNEPPSQDLLEFRKRIDFSDPKTYYLPPKDLPADVEDCDAEHIDDINAEPHYANDIFLYYRKKEVEFKVVKYIEKQPEITRAMRAVLVDWMVEVQESFELNHETLYLSVRIVDFYMAAKTVTKNAFQLLGAVSILIAAKCDERIAPAIEDFLYICDDAYKRKDFIRMEVDVLRTLNWDLSMPISYSFLRRYARCAKLTMETLTLARFILETSLMDYELIEERQSMLAAAALLLALKMKPNSGTWTRSLEYYSGYQEYELIPLMWKLNEDIMINKPSLKTIRAKYSHHIFYEVAKIQPLAPQNINIAN